MNIIDGGITAAKGFLASSCDAGIKNNEKDDMALVYSEKPCVAAATVTQNKVKAAPVQWDKRVTEEAPFIQAVVINTGIANACTGDEGLENCGVMAGQVAEEFSVSPDNVCVCSTGVIGPQLPMEKIIDGIKRLPGNLRETPEAGTKAATAIMTTDTRPKEYAVTTDISGKTVTVGGMCKGAGMIHPNMATMLCFITTDVMIKKELLQKAFSEIIDDSFNMISVDGDTSTNDTFLVLANGAAGNAPITEEGEDYQAFAEILMQVCKELAMNMAADGEGATHLIESHVINADTEANARILAKSVITSSGHDANWGRILCALGYSGAEFDPDHVDLYFSDGSKKLLIFTNGAAADYSEEEATKILKKEKVQIISDMHMGEAEAVAWGCDLTHDYVSINADYRS